MTVEQVLWLSVANASMAFAVAETKPFQGVRDWIKKKSLLLGGLFSCGYCCGHWTAFLLVAI